MKTIYYILVVVSLVFFSQSCGFKLTTKQDPYNSGYELDNKERAGRIFSLIRTDEFTIPYASKIYHKS